MMRRTRATRWIDMAIAFGFGLSVLGLLGGCIGLAGIDRSIVNHQAMDLKSRRIPAAQTILSPLDNGDGNMAEGCVTCVH